MKIEFNATTRTMQGTGASRRLRRAARVPAILYGGKNPAQPIDIDHNELFHKIKLEAFHSSVLTMHLDGKPEQVLLRDYQMHAFRPIVQHADFQRVDANSKIHMKVPLHFVNGEISPGVKVSGGIISHVMIDIEVSCLPAHLPEFVEVDLSNLSAGHSLHVSGLKPVEGVTFVTAKGEDPVVATVTIPRAAVEAEAGAAVAAADVPAVNQPPKAAAPAKSDAKKK